MGKYERPSNLLAETDRSQILTRIANELAEANRLKRIEILEYMRSHDRTVHYISQIEHNMKDQA